MLILHETIGGRFETKEFEGDTYIHLDKGYINFSVEYERRRSFNGIFKVKDIENTTYKNKKGEELILINAKADKIARSFLSSPFSRLILYSAIYVNEEEKGEIVHYTHFEELFPYISTIDEISGAMYY